MNHALTTRMTYAWYIYKIYQFKTEDWWEFGFGSWDFFPRAVFAGCRPEMRLPNPKFPKIPTENVKSEVAGLKFLRIWRWEAGGGR